MRSFIIASASAITLFSWTALAQEPSQSTVSTPDFSGTWMHGSIPGFEPLASGPTSLVNRSRRTMAEQFRLGGPEWAGEGEPSSQHSVSNLIELVGDYTNPILKPEAAEVVKKFGEISSSGRIFPDPDNMCLQNPVPYIFWNFNIQLLQQPDKVTLIYPHDSDFRVVRLNQPHPATVIPSLHGDSVGHYEGDTLVIDTVGIKLGPHRMIDRFGTPYTQALHVVERYRLLDYEATKEALERAEKEWPRVGGVDPNHRGKGLQLEFTVEDPGVFTMPWSATITYGRNANQLWDERICAENVQHDYQYNYFAEKDAHLPTADKP